MTWKDEHEKYAEYENRLITLTQHGLTKPGYLRYAGWDDWFLVYTDDDVYMVRERLHIIEPYLIAGYRTK